MFLHRSDLAKQAHLYCFPPKIRRSSISTSLPMLWSPDMAPLCYSLNLPSLTSAHLLAMTNTQPTPQVQIKLLRKLLKLFSKLNLFNLYPTIFHNKCIKFFPFLPASQTNAMDILITFNSQYGSNLGMGFCIPMGPSPSSEAG